MQGEVPRHPAPGTQDVLQTALSTEIENELESAILGLLEG